MDRVERRKGKRRSLRTGGGREGSNIWNQSVRRRRGREWASWKKEGQRREKEEKKEQNEMKIRAETDTQRRKKNVGNKNDQSQERGEKYKAVKHLQKGDNESYVKNAM